VNTPQYRFSDDGSEDLEPLQHVDREDWVIEESSEDVPDLLEPTPSPMVSIEGQIQSRGSFYRGLKNPRSSNVRRTYLIRFAILIFVVIPAVAWLIPQIEKLFK
jgi:hypothetical protein